MNSVDNIVDTIKTLDNSLQLLHGNAVNLAPLSAHGLYGNQIAEILDGIQEQQKKLMAITSEVLDQYENRYKDQLTDIEDLTSELLGDI